MKRRKLSLEDLEQMTTYELADLMANIALVLRRMPDVKLVELEPVERNAMAAPAKVAASRRKEKEQEESVEDLPDWADR